jgi:hypothetical protein
MHVKPILSVLLLITSAASVSTFGQTKAPTQLTITGDAFKDNGDGTVIDKNTGLMWQKDDDGKQRNWNDSRDNCSSLSLAGHSDWRLPSLQNLTDLWKSVGSNEQLRKRYFPSMKTSEELYGGQAVAPYWSSTVGGSSVLPGIDPDSAGFVTFNDGGVHVGTKDIFAFYSRCVRLGK